jgi:hypothetical protein
MKTQHQLILVLLLGLPLETFSQSALPSPFLNENVDSQSASATQIKFTQKKKNKIVNFAEAQLSHGKGKVKLVFDSAKLSPGQYQVLLSQSCQSNEKQQWSLGSFKTQSGHISTEFIVDHNESKWSFSTQNQALVIRKVEKKNGKSTTISCAEFVLPTEPVLAADGL